MVTGPSIACGRCWEALDSVETDCAVFELLRDSQGAGALSRARRQLVLAAVLQLGVVTHYAGRQAIDRYVARKPFAVVRISPMLTRNLDISHEQES